MHEWNPHVPRGPQLRIHGTSCCGEYELASEGGQYFVLRRTAGVYEETARGVYAYAARVWQILAARHACHDQAS